MAGVMMCAAVRNSAYPFVRRWFEPKCHGRRLSNIDKVFLGIGVGASRVKAISGQTMWGGAHQADQRGGAGKLFKVSKVCNSIGHFGDTTLKLHHEDLLPCYDLPRGGSSYRTMRTGGDRQNAASWIRERTRPSTRNPYIRWYQQNKTLVWGAAAAAVTLYATYKVTASAAPLKDEKDGVERPARNQQSQFLRLRNMMKNYSTAASTIAETAALVSGDLQAFLTSDSSELPQSLRQLNKLFQASELQETVSTFTASVVRGVAKATGGPQSPNAPPLVDTIIEAVLSERGRGLIGMAVGVAMRNSTTAVCEFIERRMESATLSSGSVSGLGVKDILDLLASDQGEKVLTMLLTHSIRTAVTSYVDATAGYNLYNDMLASLVKQEHRDALTDLLSRISASFCREAVLSYRRASAMGAASFSFPSGTAASASTSAPSHTPANHAFASKHSAANATTIAMVANEPGVPAEASRAVSLPAVKSNGHLPVAQANLRSSQSSQLNKQYSLGSSSGFLGGVSSNALAAALGRGMVAQAPPAWLRQVVELVRERDVRSLAVDMVKHASREATRGAVEGFLQGTATGGSEQVGSGVLVLPPSAAGYKLFVMATLAVSLCTYVLSPRVMLL
ncbi:hypothetical protein VOLCADRAFT_89328 [Volvox carteri f. nagariensis]|uniref:Uncharacterized protein n=1 Tax=Volvox carteri f. nagariensis TaxID=3068 RepID=D8TRF1_VOLCA|nr:uncharacterized protein VOLCADRAFT_89328 [Volvox carteri f. nagariensis]EFJ49982.1 hypothetical protein VOLCADRAFT_89328 [Volvox carteri f. nagariensis]|eukprot:XP_002949047.1 hypothetical protein VOLCADRAFT_89328 [Volvox carteri f. nagariensis]